MFQKCAPAGVDAPTCTLFIDDLNAWLADPNAKGAVNDGYGTIVYHEGRWMTARQKGNWKGYLEHQTAVTELKGMKDDVMLLSAEEACYETTATMVVLCECVAAQELVVEATLERKERFWEDKKEGPNKWGKAGTGLVGRGQDKVTLKTGLVACGQDKVTLKTGLVACGQDKVTLKTGKVALKTDKKTLDALHLLTLKVHQMDDKKQKEVRVAVHER
jgi:hypothetical protein